MNLVGPAERKRSSLREVTCPTLGATIRPGPRRAAIEDRILTAGVPPGSRFEGYKTFILQDLVVKPVALRFRRERWRPSYSFRSLIFRSERNFALAPDRFVAGGWTIAYDRVDRVHLYQVRAQNGDMIDRCRLHGEGRTAVLQSAHIAGLGRVQDRKTQYQPFVRELLLRIAHANPSVLVFAGMPWQSRVGWLLVLVLVVALGAGGLTLAVTGAWEGLWLIAVAVTTAPVTLAMMNKKPSCLVTIEEITAPNGSRDWLG